MKARAWPLATFTFGLATLALLLAFSMLPDVRAAYPNGDFGQAMSAFQRSVTMTDLEGVFGAPPDSGKIAAMHAANTLDLWAFIAAYVLFLVSAAAMLAGSVKQPLAWLAIVPALIAGAADAVETSAQLRITADWANAAQHLPIVAPACWTKYFALAVTSLGISAICFIGPHKRVVIGALGLAPIVGVTADWADIVQVPSMMTIVFGGHWIVLLALAAFESFKKPS